MKSKTIVLLFVLPFVQHFSFAQSTTVDSLQTILKTVKEGNTKADVLNALAYELRNKNPDSSLYFSNVALAIATQLNYKMGVANSYLNKGSVAIQFGEYEQALKTVNEAIHIYDMLLASEKTGDSTKILKQKARAYSMIGNTQFSQGNYSASMIGYSASLKIRQAIGDKTGIASVYNNIGSVYLEQGNYPEALKIQLEGLTLREEIGDKEGIAASLNNIGNIYDGMSNYAEALKNHFAALKIRKEIGDKRGIGNSYNNIGGIYATTGNFSEALINTSAALKIREEIGDQRGIVTSYNSLGSVYTQKKNYSEALQNYTAALKMAEEIGDKESAAYAFMQMGSVYSLLTKTGDAALYLNKALTLAKELGNRNYIKSAYNELAMLDSLQGNYKQSLAHYKLYIAYRDSLFNEASTKKTVQSQMQYEFDKKESVTKAEQEKKDVLSLATAKRQRIIRNVTFAGLAFVLLFSIVVYRQRNKIGREKKRSDELVIEKEMLMKEIHHRVKNNLEVISSLLELQSEGMDAGKAKAAVMEGQSRVQSIALIHHKLYSNNDVASVEFKNFVSDLFKQVESVFKKPNTTVEFKIIAEETKISIDAAVPLGLILNELLTNSFKYAMSENRKNKITIQLNPQVANGSFLLVFKDNGPGVPTEFDLQKSTSLGMKVIQLLTKQLGGKLNFYNDGGSVFEIPFIAAK